MTRSHRPVGRCALLLTCCLSGFASGAEPRERPWIERVERDRDRAAGRVVDDQQWETRRQQDRRDVRTGRLREPGRFEQFDEERERQLLLDARARRAGRAAAKTRDEGSVILREPPQAGTNFSPAAEQAAADERALSEARDKLDRMTRAVNAAERRSLRSLRRRLTLEGRPDDFAAESAAVRQRHGRLRTGHRADFDRTRSRILGK